MIGSFAFLQDLKMVIILPVIFASGKFFNFYTLLDPKENIIVKTTACIWVNNAFGKRTMRISLPFITLASVRR